MNSQSARNVGSAPRNPSSSEPECHLALETPVGPLVLSGDDEVLTGLLLPGSPVPVDPGRPPSAPVRAAAAQLEEYFAGRRRVFDLPLDPRGTEFQRRVWFTLAEIGYAQTISYRELAEWVERPTAWRAVGQANGANPIPIILPCHRVVASGGGLGGYGGGLELKRSLLDLEGRAAA